jgi:SagB-type dehydrogenase family enzyme
MMKGKLVAVCVVIAGMLVPGTFGCGQGAEGEPRGKEIALPAPATRGGMSLTEAIAKRRSIRSFAPDPLTLEQISQLAWSAQGITEPGRGLRAAPSAGALYPLELYLLTEDGVFHYLPQGHKLVQLSDADRRGALSQAALGQSSVAQAALDIVIAGVFSRTEAKYRDRARQYVYIEAGHVGQNIHLQAVALGLGSVPVGAFRDQAVSEVIGLSAEQTPIYIIPVGRPAV